ncbi:ATP-binding cassette domain-containing protein [Dermabacteraceae bacterium P13103]
MRAKKSPLFAPFAALPHVWRASPAPFLLLSLFLLLQGLIGPATALLLGDTVGSFTNGGFGPHLPRLLLMWALLTAASLFTFPVVFSLSGRLNEDLSTYLQGLLLQRGTSLQTMELFDDPRAYDVISLVVKEAKSRPVNYIVLYSYILRGGIAIASFAAILWSFAWYIPLLLIGAALPLNRALTAMREANWTGIRERAQASRYLDYLVSLFLRRETALEVRALEMQAAVQQRFMADKKEMLSELRRHRRQGLLANLPGLALGAAMYASAIALLLVRADSAGIAVAGLAAGVQAFSLMQQTVSEVVENLAYLREKAFFFQDLNTLLAFTERTLPARALSASQMGTGVSNEEKHLAGDPEAASVIEFKDVSFTYPNSAEPAVKEVSFRVAEGETLAIVGENGSGKSTLLKLACGFYGPDSGTVLANGLPLTSARASTWRREISPIFQHTTAFAMTFAQNLSPAGQASPDAMQSALDAVYGQQPPRPLREELGVEFGGSELSGGELQRLGIARAMARDGRIVVLDEPTSAIDPLFEAEVFSAIRSFVRGRTAIIVTHRMPQALSADRVLVLAAGEVGEFGSPRELLAAGGAFARMVRSQASLFNEPDS